MAGGGGRGLQRGGLRPATARRSAPGSPRLPPARCWRCPRCMLAVPPRSRSSCSPRKRAALRARLDARCDDQHGCGRATAFFFLKKILSSTANASATPAGAVLDERVRIARELHDVVAHHVSVMGVQAGAARRLLDRAPRPAPTGLASIEGSSRQAVAEMQRCSACCGATAMPEAGRARARARRAHGPGRDRPPCRSAGRPAGRGPAAAAAGRRAVGVPGSCRRR